MCDVANGVGNILINAGAGPAMVSGLAHNAAITVLNAVNAIMGGGAGEFEGATGKDNERTTLLNTVINVTSSIGNGLLMTGVSPAVVCPAVSGVATLVTSCIIIGLNLTNADVVAADENNAANEVSDGIFNNLINESTDTSVARDVAECGGDGFVNALRGDDVGCSGYSVPVELAAAAIVNAGFSEEEVNTFINIMDGNNNGCISSEEILNFTADSNWAGSYIGPSGDGTDCPGVSRPIQQFRDNFIAQGYPEDAVNILISVIDRNADGCIDSFLEGGPMASVINDFMNTYGGPSEATGCSTSSVPVSSLKYDMIESGYSEVEADTFLTLIDIDADGCIETREFIDSFARYNQWVEDYDGEELTAGDMFQEFIDEVVSGQDAVALTTGQDAVALTTDQDAVALTTGQDNEFEMIAGGNQ